jgi:hypothetical protein
MGGQRDIELIFDRQEGVAERSQLLARGLGEDAIAHRLETGRYRLLHRNVYALGPLSMRGRLIGALLAGGGDSHLCLASALVPYRMQAFTATIDIAVPANRRDGLRVTTIERTLVDIAATGADIRRMAHEAIAKKLTAQAKLKAFAEPHRGSTRTATRPSSPSSRTARATATSWDWGSA